ncbi:unnamed protein product [Nippostrongylus brasiliensis]|uniref:Uncharacterized protein n=1 Tax=Nippostrongylus brasiliensis TaxID=27835 RepID=A0A0N4YB26_NIPBR|nr:hypothetical protein Q1695_014371 [Nippostrongylus brasiliensis]VDL77228.1 unnamed protein product [Nippostrongylus brasiliensis]
MEAYLESRQDRTTGDGKKRRKNGDLAAGKLDDDSTRPGRQARRNKLKSAHSKKQWEFSKNHKTTEKTADRFQLEVVRWREWVEIEEESEGTDEYGRWSGPLG